MKFNNKTIITKNINEDMLFSLEFPSSYINCLNTEKDYIVCYPDFGEHKMTLLFIMTGEEFKNDKFYTCPKMLLYNYVLSDEEIKKITEVKLEPFIGYEKDNE